MAHVTIDSHKKKIEDLFLKVSLIASDVEMQSHWARYLCVLACGFVEVSMKTILEEYVKRRSSFQVANYTQVQLRRFYNPTTNKILDTMGCFDLSWKKLLEEGITDNMRDAVDSIVNNKNLIAHGQTTGITYLRIKNYFCEACKVIDLLEKTVV